VKLNSATASALREAVAIELDEADDHLGWRTLDDGSSKSVFAWARAACVTSLTASGCGAHWRLIAERFDRNVSSITAQQDILISGISGDDREAIAHLLVTHHVRAVENWGLVERIGNGLPGATHVWTGPGRSRTSTAEHC